MENQSNTKNGVLTRRNFLIAGGGLTIGIAAYVLFPKLKNSHSQEDGEALEPQKVTAWVHLQEDGKMTIFNPAAEMGQGSLTALPVIFAEEMDADWSKVAIDYSPIEPDTYGFPGWGNSKRMITVGSITIKNYFQSMRQAGAQARYVLMHSVAQHWDVPIEELQTEPSVVLHPKTKRRISYGEIVPILNLPESVPEIPDDQLKKPEDFRLIGTIMPRYDIPAKVDGSAKFAIDVQVPNMRYGVIERGNLHGASPKLKNEEQVLGMPGILEVVQLDYGIGVVADTLERALEAKDHLDIEWNEGVKAAEHTSQTAFDQYQDIAIDKSVESKILNNQGDVLQAFKNAAKTYRADYKNDYVYHAQMEPLNAVAAFSQDTQSIEIWAGTQSAGSLRPEVAEALGLDVSNVKFNQHFLGGGLGRRSLHDNVIEAALLSKAVNQPVKLIWTREDDLRYGLYRPMSLQRMTAGTDSKGKITGFSHVIVGDGDRLLASGAKNEFYDIPNQFLEMRVLGQGIRLKHWRSVGHGPNKFAIESFIDEIAKDQNIDPLDMRRELMANAPKALRTLEKAAEMANWGSPLPDGRARGIAFGERSGALCSGICEISLDRENGKIKVHHFWTAVDAGIIIQPDNVVAQMEGGIIMGIGSVLSERVTIENGRVQQSNFHDYPILRMEDTPENIEVSIIPSNESPQGIGEASLPLVGGAIANAFAALTGKRLRHMPFTPDRVLEALNS